MTENTKTSQLADKPIKRVGFGAMQLAGPGVFGPPKDPEAAAAVLRRAIELGVDHIDTSQFYGPDVVNQLIHDTLHPYPEDLKLVTKVGGRRDDKGAWLAAQTPDELRAGVEDNLRTLEIERIDAANLRLMPPDQDPSAAPVPLDEQLGAMADMRQEGKLDLVGISNVSAEQVREAIELTDIACVQNSFSLIDRSGEDVLELCEEHGIAFVPFFPLGSAFTGGPKKLAADPAIAEVAARHDATPSQVALAWLLHRSDRILLIPGTTSISHLEENLAAADIALDADDMTRLEDAEHVGDPMASVQH